MVHDEGMRGTGECKGVFIKLSQRNTQRIDGENADILCILKSFLKLTVKPLRQKWYNDEKLIKLLLMII